MRALLAGCLLVCWLGCGKRGLESQNESQNETLRAFPFVTSQQVSCAHASLRFPRPPAAAADTCCSWMATPPPAASPRCSP